MKKLSDCRVTVIGLGLMGASLCMDLIENNLCKEVRGVDRHTGTVLQAFLSGAVDLATDDLVTGVQGADIVILSTPVRTIVKLLEDIAPHLWPGTVIMDMGSTKREIYAALEKLPENVQPVGAHPMTGKETAGFTAAEPGLYGDATWVLSPLARTSSDALELAHELAYAVGAKPVVLEPERHDRLVASISHLPYLVASALVDTVAMLGESDPQVWQLAAGGFRDTSRVAASDTRMFIDILLTNRAIVLEQLENFAGQIEHLRQIVAHADEETLRSELERSREVRLQWPTLKQ